MALLGFLTTTVL